MSSAYDCVSSKYDRIHALKFKTTENTNSCNLHTASKQFSQCVSSQRDRADSLHDLKFDFWHHHAIGSSSTCSLKAALALIYKTMSQPVSLLSLSIQCLNASHILSAAQEDGLPACHHIASITTLHKPRDPQAR